ncbi:hypothetical protein [Nocardioides jensenii]|uniref:hypothetical protein n=1 Tax=Nocardioides jensenii TaxID=1843 RepID=UPI00082DB4D8|nr:hypothetical protein [Nocardioides jensenii]
MTGKLRLLTGFAAGYVLGARAGRQRYEQIAAQARKVWRDPRVQAQADSVRQTAGEKGAEAGHALKDKVTEAAAVARSKATEAAALAKDRVSSTGSSHGGAGSTDIVGTVENPARSE